MQLTIERPQGYPLTTWLEDCQWAYRTAELNDETLTTQEQERRYNTRHVFSQGGKFWRLINVANDCPLRLVGDNHKVLLLYPADLPNAEYAEMERVVTAIRVCLP